MAFMHSDDKVDNIILSPIKPSKNFILRNLHFTFFALFLFFVYSPIFFIDFGIHNDYSLWSYDKSKNWFGFPESRHLLMVGRPLGALLLNIHFFFLNSITDFALSRFISLILTVLSAYLIYLYLIKQLLIDPFWALCLSFCIFLLPSSQLFVIYVTNLVPGSLNIFFSLVSYFLLKKIELNNPFNPRSNIFYFTSAFCIFLGCLFIYPPTALFFLVLTFSNILFLSCSDWREIRLQVTRDITFCSSGMIIYFILNKFVILPLLSQRYPHHLESLRGTIHDFSVSANFTRIANTFVESSKVALSGVWHPIYGDRAALIIILLVLISVSISICSFAGFRLTHMEILKSSLQRFFVGSFILILSNTPLLLSSGGVVCYRVLFPCSAMMIILLFWTMFQVNRVVARQKLIISVISFMVIFSGIVASINLLHTALNANIELNFIRQKIYNADLSRMNNILLIKPFEAAPFINRELRYEFSVTATSHIFIEGIIDAVLCEIGIDRRSITGGIINSDRAGKVLYTDEKTLLIDMNSSRLRLGNLKQFDIARISVSAATSGPNHSGIRAFDYSNDPNSFWEAGGFPQWIQIAYQENKKIAKYSLLHGKLGGPRMPKAWQFQASKDGVNWFDLDKRRNQTDWKPNEERTYNVEKPSSYKYYRILFTEGNEPILRIYEIKLID